MARTDSPSVEEVIGDTINETARGDPDALAARIAAALAEAGFRIVSANGREDTALGPQRARTRESTEARTATPGSLPAIPRRARPSSCTKQMRHQAVR